MTIRNTPVFHSCRATDERRSETGPRQIGRNRRSVTRSHRPPASRAEHSLFRRCSGDGSARFFLRGAFFLGAVCADLALKKQVTLALKNLTLKNERPVLIFCDILEIPALTQSRILKRRGILQQQRFVYKEQIQVVSIPGSRNAGTFLPTGEIHRSIIRVGSSRTP